MARITNNDLVRAIRDLSYSDPTGLDFTFVQRINEQGWTFEKPAPLGNTLRIEGVHFSPKTLRSCYDEAMS